MIVLSYLWLLALVPLLVEKDDKEVQWHAKHGIVLMLAEIVFWIAVTIVQMALGTILGCVVGLLSFFVWLGIVVAAHHGDRQGRERRPADRAGRVAVRRQALGASSRATANGTGPSARPSTGMRRRRPSRSPSSCSRWPRADLARAPERQWLARAAVGGIHLYQATLSRAFAAARRGLPLRPHLQPLRRSRDSALRAGARRMDGGQARCCAAGRGRRWARWIRRPSG